MARLVVLLDFSGYGIQGLHESWSLAMVADGQGVPMQDEDGAQGHILTEHRET
jgi:hypothetical protein